MPGKHKPARNRIPEQVSGLYHINGFYFKIFEQEFEKTPEMQRCFAPPILSQRLLYSESWNDIMGAIEERGLSEKLVEAEERRKREIRKGESFRIDTSDYVESPEIERMLSKLRESGRISKMEEGTFIPFCASV